LWTTQDYFCHPVPGISGRRQKLHIAFSKEHSSLLNTGSSFLPPLLKYPSIGEFMANIELQPLPLATSDFSELRRNKQIYVDKTALVYELASGRQKLFLTRPRRFGKSLLVSTFESLFKYGLRDFKGLAIQNLWKDRSTYQVVRLDFSEVKSFKSAEDFEYRFNALLIASFMPCGFQFSETFPLPIVTQLSSWLKTLPGSSLVLLIDEYDAPLTACLNNRDLFENVRTTLSSFYSILKSNDASLRFFFMTGITKFSKAGIFSELNNLKDISLLPKFGALVGYTHEEVKHYFKGYLVESSKKLGMDETELLKDLTSFYDGFCFETTAQCHVFAPWSLLNFFSYPELGFVNYWFESGGQPKVLLEYIKSRSIKEPAEYEREKKVQISALSGASNLDIINDKVLLTQAGYLTIKAVKDTTVTLGYPNKEVAISMGRFYTEIMLNEDAMNRTGEGFLDDYLRVGKAKKFVDELNRIILGVDHTKFPLDNEASCRAAVHLMLACSQLSPIPELHNALGESDLEMDVGAYHWVFEFKFTRENASAERLCKAGIKQVKDRKYGEQFKGKQLRRLVLVFSQEAKQFICWSEVC